MSHATREEIEEVVACTLEDLRPDSKPGELTAATDPIRHWGLVSMDGVEWACTLEERLGITISDKENPFVAEDKGRKRSRNVGEIVEYLVTKVEN